VSWSDANDGLPVRSRGLQGIAVAGATVLVATDNDGVWRSDDAGEHWSQSGLLGEDVLALGQDPQTPDVVLASVSSIAGYGLWRSHDRGHTWQPLIGVLGQAVAGNFVMQKDGAGSAVAFAGLLGRTDGVNGRCVARSVDGGAHWTMLGDGLPVPASPYDEEHCFVAADPAAPETLYLAIRIFAGFPAVLSTATFRSPDGGEHWTALGGPGGFPVAAAGGGVLWTPNGRSADGGSTWTAFPQPIPTAVPSDAVPSAGAIAPVPGAPTTALFSHLPAGVVRVDAGGTARISNRGLFATAASEFAVRATTPTSFLVRSESGLWQHAGPGTLWQRAGPPPGDPRAGFAFLDPEAHPEKPQQLYVIAFGASIDDRIVHSGDGGAHWRYLPGPGTRISDLETTPVSADVLYAAVGGGPNGDQTCGVFSTLDLGRHWNCLGPKAPMFQVVVDRLAPQTLYAVQGGALGRLRKSSDGGRTWKVADAGIGARPRTLAIARNATRRLYLVTSGGVFRSDDGARTWRKTTGELPRRFRRLLTSVSLAVDPRDPDVVYIASSELGVYRSDDAGEHWSLLDPSFPAAAFSGRIALDPTDPGVIYAGTFYEGLLTLRVP